MLMFIILLLIKSIRAFPYQEKYDICIIGKINIEVKIERKIWNENSKNIICFSWGYGNNDRL